MSSSAAQPMPDVGVQPLGEPGQHRRIFQPDQQLLVGLGSEVLDLLHRCLQAIQPFTQLRISHELLDNLPFDDGLQRFALLLIRHLGLIRREDALGQGPGQPGIGRRPLNLLDRHGRLAAFDRPVHQGSLRP